MSGSVEISRKTSVLVVHDVVNSFLDPAGKGYDADIPAMMANIATLLAAVRAAGLPVFFAAPGPGDESVGPRPGATKSVWGTPAAEVPASLGPLPGEAVVRKPRYGAFFGSALAERMREAGRDTMILCGLSLAGGIETSVRDAHNRDLKSIVAADACLCRPVPDQGWGPVAREEVARVTLSLLAQRFARVASTEEICRALRGAAEKAGAPAVGARLV